MGGLNIGSIRNKNTSLLFKWIWRLLHDPDALWQKVIKNKYGYTNGLTAHDLCIPSGSGPWRFICSSIINNPTAGDFLKSKIRKAIGNGKNTLFWLDIWVGNVPLKNCFPRLFSIANDSHASVASCGSWNSGNWVWNLEWRRSFRPRDEVEWSSLQVLLKSVCLSQESEDSLIWTPHKLGMFTVKSCSLELSKPSPQLHSKVINWKRMWKGLIPPRVEVFTWLALLGKISSKMKLASMNIIPSTEVYCIFCSEYPESSEHLLLHCAFSRDLWMWWINIWEIKWVFPQKLHEAFEQWSCVEKNPNFKKIWCAIFSIIIWTIWKERNARVFKNISCSLAQLQDLILTRLMWWMKGWGGEFPYSMDDVLRHPKCLSWQPSSLALGPKKLNPDHGVWFPPMSGSLKWNVDASVSAGGVKSAIGGVLRNCQGNFVCIFSCPIPPIEINSAEVLAIFRAIQICKTFDHLAHHPMTVESDSRNAVEWCNDLNRGPWNLNFQLNSIRNARSLWPELCIVHRKRDSNMVADALAKQGLTRDDEFLAWL
ncbi:uncharacterized protein LOC125494726 [Beta vulgaris subsp. vulgaris]|uniref:uncharacterized protein LOC125494726 n=1 Tax=Beta vulgaris subsp. vulgaris TaxID=3555 RepID=UPI002036DE94|nr:uncharacterized protein LOC125494726 [Beta vulgaris subsp. vulgaris]